MHRPSARPLIDKLDGGFAAKRRAKPAKVCGAGGGGCVVFFVEEGAQQRVSAALTDAGGTVLPFAVARKGLRVTG